MNLFCVVFNAILHVHQAIGFLHKLVKLVNFMKVVKQREER